MLLVYPPFCSPASPPYSLTHLKSIVGGEILDLNLLYHQKKFKDLNDFLKRSTEVYSLENKKVINGDVPDYFEEFLDLLSKHDTVAFSIVYSSQVFYTYPLLKALSEKGIKCIVGGPAVNDKLLEYATYFDSIEEFSGINEEKPLDFSEYKGYFVPELVIPLKTVNTCYYKGCKFCTHHHSEKYKEFSLEIIKETLIKSKAKKVFLIDDMNHKKRLLELSKVFKELKIKWACQLKPDRTWNSETLNELYSSGLRVVIWGVESGSNRVLKLMNKGTNVSDIENVLKNSHNSKIKNVVYMMFGFPGETEKEFLESVEFLERNIENIDLVSPATFGLQKGSYIYEHPEEFGIFNIQEKKRTILDPTISYSCSGLSWEEAEKLKKKYKHRINSVNKYPKWMNLLREHMLFE